MIFFSEKSKLISYREFCVIKIHCLKYYRMWEKFFCHSLCYSLQQGILSYLKKRLDKVHLPNFNLRTPYERFYGIALIVAPLFVVVGRLRRYSPENPVGSGSFHGIMNLIHHDSYTHGSRLYDIGIVEVKELWDIKIFHKIFEYMIYAARSLI